jgi:hypothetical protein
MKPRSLPYAILAVVCYIIPLAMSGVHTLDGVPYTFRYGMTDEEGGKTWRIVGRNGVGFSVHVDRSDIAGTPFETEWSKYCVEDHSENSDVKAILARSSEFCDFTLTKMSSMLQELAPMGSRHWMTLEDWLWTPEYKVRFMKDDVHGDALPKVIEGPTITPAFELRPQPLSLLQWPEGLPRIHASDIVILDHEKDLRLAPSKVEVGRSGETCSLLRAEGQVMVMGQKGVEEGLTPPSKAVIEQVLSVEHASGAKSVAI